MQKVNIKMVLVSLMAVLVLPMVVHAEGVRDLREKVRAVTLDSVSGTTLTITGRDGKQYTLTTNANTKLEYRCGGKADLGTFKAGDKLMVKGTLNSDKTSVNASRVRDMSLHRCNGTVVGVVTAINGNTWTLDKVGNDNVTYMVTVSDTTKYIQREKTVTRDSVTVGTRVAVKGLKDNQAHTVESVTMVRVFGPKPTPAQ